jgi:transglutaminase-like putative cysteine protease
VQVESSAAPLARRLKVTHANHYQYTTPILRSTHRLHLRPVHDRWQTVSSHRLVVSPTVELLEYEDVFGNSTTTFDVPGPYTALSIVAESIVELSAFDPFDFASRASRDTFPVHWMPWESKMLVPFLAPVELPETQLNEIHEFAMGFVTRNRQDLLETLFDMNLTLFREFQYLPRSTSLETTPHEVLTSKHGVCQDFANLMICMARLLNIPARYVCGYLMTGNTGDSRALPDASHAWVQLYLPHAGWKDFDPTNGVLPATNHVRVAVGRHWRDTAPTAGTLYSSAPEQLTVQVEVAPLD